MDIALGAVEETIGFYITHEYNYRTFLTVLYS